MFKGVAADSKMNPETQKKEKDWWTPSVKMMMQSDFLNSLVNYDKEGIQ
jgi:hypothetical protein